MNPLLKTFAPGKQLRSSEKIFLITFKGNGYIFSRGNSVKNILTPFRKGVYSKRKEFAPLGSKFFPFGVDLFQKRFWCAVQKTGSHKC